MNCQRVIISRFKEEKGEGGLGALGATSALLGPLKRQADPGSWGHAVMVTLNLFCILVSLIPGIWTWGQQFTCP